MSVNQSDKEQIFNSAADLSDAAQRAAYLDQACGDDAQLRVEIEELLRHDVDAGSFLEHPAVDFAPTIAIGEFDTLDDSAGEVSLAFLEPSDKAGCIGTLEHYEVIELVGRGGMGLVLKAFDPKLNRVVAIKVMAPELAANAMAVKRFLREARAAAAVSHDHVVTIHAIHDSHRPPFIVMEFVDGQSLQEKIDQTGGLELEGVLRIGMQTARGLAAAHEQGLVHRDIKPANILLENGVERVKLTDFGLARAVDDVSVTQTGQIAGTPQFMSPEQAQGHAIDARSDLFSLGSLLYTMCTGRPPFRAETAVAMLRRVTDDDPRPIREVNADIPDWLEAITAKLLAKDPDARFRSAAEVAELLSQHLAHLQHPKTAPKPQPIVPPIRGTGLPPAKPAMEEAPCKPAPRHISRGPTTAVILAVIGCLAAAIVAGVVIFVRTNYGTIRVEVNDPDTTVTIDDEMGINLQNTTSGTLTVHVGEHKLHIQQGNLEFETDAFRVKRGEHVVVRVERIGDKLGARLVTPHDNGTVSTQRDRVIGLQRVAEHSETAGHEITEVRRFEGHDHWVYGLLFTPDGGQAVSVANDRSVRIWDVDTGEVLRRIEVERSATAVDLSSDGRVLAVAIGSFKKEKDTGLGLVSLVDFQTGNEIRRVNGQHSNEITAVVFSPDNRHLATASVDGTSRLWDVESGAEIRRFEERDRAIGDAQFTSDGRRLVTFERFRAAHVWDVATGRLLHELGDSEASELRAIELLSDGKSVLLVNGRGLIERYDVESGRRISEFHTPTEVFPEDVAVTLDGNHVLLANDDGLLDMLDIPSGNSIARVTANGSVINALALSPSGRYLLSGGGRRSDKETKKGIKDDDFSLRLWRLPEKLWPVEQLTEVRRFEGRTRMITSVAVSPDGRFLLSGALGGGVLLSNLETGKAEKTFAEHATGVFEVGFSRDGTAFSCSEDQTVRRWDVSSGQEIRSYVGHTGWVSALAVSPDGKHLLTGSTWTTHAQGQQGIPQDNSLRLWDVETGKEVRRFEDVLFAITGVAFAPDGKSIVAGGFNSMLGLWDMEPGKRIRRFTAPTNVLSVAFSPDGAQVASSHVGGLKDGKWFDPEHCVIILWDVKTGGEIRRLRGHTARINSLAFSPDGRFIASGAGEGHNTTDGWYDTRENTVRIWDTATGEEFARADLGISVQSVAFTPDGRHVVTGGGRRGAPGSADLRLWRLPVRVWSKNENGITEIRRLKGHTKRPMDLLFLADGKHALSCSGDETIRQWNIETGEVVRQFVDDNMRVPSCLALSVDEKILLSGHGDGDRVRVWDFETGRVQRT